MSDEHESLFDEWFDSSEGIALLVGFVGSARHGIMRSAARLAWLEAIQRTLRKEITVGKI